MIRAQTNILLVDSSAAIHAQLKEALAAAPGMKIVATADTEDLAVKAVRHAKPDVAIIDVGRARLDGLEVTRRIMRECPLPIVAVSGPYEDQVSASFRALEAGALAFARVPTTAKADLAEFLRTVRLMADVKVVRRGSALTKPVAPPASAAAGTDMPIPRRNIRLIAIGASTGGPAALATLLGAITRKSFPPIVIVQHIADGFTDGLVTWLGRSTGHEIHLAGNGDQLVAGHVYVAPEGRHLAVANGKIRLDDAPIENGLRPAVSYLFRTVRQAYSADAAAVLLSGMGKDGAQELLQLRQAGAVTFAQDKDSSLIFGMPGEAIRLQAALYAMPPEQIGAALVALTGARDNVDGRRGEP